MEPGLRDQDRSLRQDRRDILTPAGDRTVALPAGFLACGLFVFALFIWFVPPMAARALWPDLHVMYPTLKNPERAAKIAAAKPGKPRSAETIKAMRRANIGKKLTVETRAKMSAAHKRRSGNSNHSRHHRQRLRGRDSRLC